MRCEAASQLSSPIELQWDRAAARPANAPNAGASDRRAGQWRLYARALSYFRPDARLIALLLVLITLSIGLGLLQSWPMAILIDAVLTAAPHTDWVQRLFLAPLPATMLGQVIGVTV